MIYFINILPSSCIKGEQMQQYILQYIETNCSKAFENLFVVSG